MPSICNLVKSKMVNSVFDRVEKLLEKEKMMVTSFFLFSQNAQGLFLHGRGKDLIVPFQILVLYVYLPYPK